MSFSLFGYWDFIYIEREINNLLALEDSNDKVVLTYSGHGDAAYGSSIISHDLYYMSSSWFKSKFDTADSSHIYFTFDACQIGGMDILVETDRVGAFASDIQYSWESPALQNGVFTYYQMEGWNTINYDNFQDDGNYAISEMINWASTNYDVDPFVVDLFSGPMYP